MVCHWYRSRRHYYAYEIKMALETHSLYLWVRLNCHGATFKVL